MSSDKKTMLRACCAMLPLALVAALTLVLVASPHAAHIARRADADCAPLPRDCGMAHL